MQIKERMTTEGFEAFINRPENADKRFELIDGEIIEVPSNPFLSVIAGLILYAIRHWLVTNEQPGYLTSEGSDFIIEGRVFAPNVAYARDLPTNKGYESTPPLLAVEVISDPHSNTEQSDLRRKLTYYLRAGVLVLSEQDTLTIESILPGFKLAVKDIFPKE